MVDYPYIYIDMYIKMDRRVDRHAVEQAGGEQTGKQADRRADTQASGQIYGQTGGRTDKWSAKKVGRGGQTNKWTHMGGQAGCPSGGGSFWVVPARPAEPVMYPRPWAIERTVTHERACVSK